MKGKLLRPSPDNLFESSNDDSDTDEFEDTNSSEIHPNNKKYTDINIFPDVKHNIEAEERIENPSIRMKRINSLNVAENVNDVSNKKQKLVNSRKFFDEYADASDDDEEEGNITYYETNKKIRKHATDDEIRKEHLDAEAEEVIRQQNRRRAQMSRFSGDVDADNVVKHIEERHAMQSRTVDRSVFDNTSMTSDRGYGHAISTVSQQSLLPSVSDPTLWIFRCSAGKEQELVYQIMNKCIAYARQGRPLGITSALVAQSKGKIYVESISEPYVVEAVQGIRNLLMFTMRIVPINDMTTVLTVTPKKRPVKKNEWVRMTRGHFKGDLALVRTVRESGLKCIVQCVPRLDLTLSDLLPEQAKIRRRTIRPPQKFFNPQEIASLGKYSLTRMRFPGMPEIMCDHFEGNYYFDGYLLKEVNVGTMMKTCSDEDPPTLDELQRFRQHNRSAKDWYDGGDEENEGSRIAKSLLDELVELQTETDIGKLENNKIDLIMGDMVEVVEGDLVGMRGKVLCIDRSTVKVKPTNAADLGETTEIEFLVNQVKKYIAVGVHVKVTSGRFSNETGLVVAVDKLNGERESTAIIVTDLTHKEVCVRISQLQESAEVASGHDKLGGYELHDLVVLSGGETNEVGVIVRVGREEFTVVNNHGIVREVRPEEIRCKRNATSGRAVALDMKGNQIRVGDSVRIIEGSHKGKIATIKRMSRAQLFLYSQTKTENAGIIVVRSRSCLLDVSSTQRGRKLGVSDNNTLNNTRSQQSWIDPVGGRFKSIDGLVGKTVRIQSGKWKGYLGVVSDATPTHLQVELHSQLKKVMVIRDRVAVIGDKYGANNDLNRANTNSTSTMTLSTSFNGIETPVHGGETPMHDDIGGDFTPSHSENNDDVWRPDKSNNISSVDNLPNVNDPSVWVIKNSTFPGHEKSDQSFSTSSVNESKGGWSSRNNQLVRNTWIPLESDRPKFNKSPSDSIIFSEEQSAENATSVAVDEISHDYEEVINAQSIEATSGQDIPKWFMERVCVQIEKSKSNGVIQEINNSNATVQLEDKTLLKVHVGELMMNTPKEHDTVLVTGGGDVGVEGELVCIDGEDAILKDSNEEFKIVDFVHLAKIIGEA